MKKLNKKTDVIISVFGEIDTRLHFYYHFKKNKGGVSLSKLIIKTATRYISFISQLKQKGYTIYVLSVNPAGEQPNIYGYDYYANRKTKVVMTKTFNKILKTLSAKKDIPFVDIYPFLVDKKDNRLAKLKLDRIHFNTQVSQILLDYLHRRKII